MSPSKVCDTLNIVYMRGQKDFAGVMLLKHSSAVTGYVESKLL